MHQDPLRKHQASAKDNSSRDGSNGLVKGVEAGCWKDKAADNGEQGQEIHGQRHQCPAAVADCESLYRFHRAPAPLFPGVKDEIRIVKSTQMLRIL